MAQFGNICLATCAINLIAALAFGEITYRASLLPPFAVEDSEAVDISGNNVVGYIDELDDIFGNDLGAHATIWHDSSTSVDLHPAGYEQSKVSSVWGDTQVGAGYRYVNSVLSPLALMWNGSAESVINLHPSTASTSIANDVYDNTQVGNIDHRAVLWQGSVSSRVNLHPASGYAASDVYAIYENTQVGHGIVDSTSRYALLWHGTAESVIKLHPMGFTSSFALDVYGDMQVGYGEKNILTDERALLWRGTAESVVDLHPPEYGGNFAGSVAYATNGIQQVGFASDNPFAYHFAYVWSGSAETAVNLQPFLSGLPILLFNSNAYSINEDGVIVGSAVGVDGYHAVMWTPVLVGDYNGDGEVNAADYCVWRDSHGQTGPNLPADGNRDEEIDDADYVVWKQHFGESLTDEIGEGSAARAFTHSALPEPDTVILITFVGLTILLPTRTRRY